MEVGGGEEESSNERIENGEESKGVTIERCGRKEREGN